jgi:hypothetical protein
LRGSDECPRIYILQVEPEFLSRGSWIQGCGGSPGGGNGQEGDDRLQTIGEDDCHPVAVAQPETVQLAGEEAYLTP